MKRILSILLTFTLLFTAGVFASAAGDPGPGDGSSQELPSEEFIRNYALSFMQDSRPSANISIDEFLPLYALTNRQSPATMSHTRIRVSVRATRF